MPRISFLLLMVAAAAFAQRPNAGPSPRPDPAMEAALKEIVPLTTGLREDDHPAVAARNGTAWAVWVSYSETEGTTQIFARSWKGGAWSKPERLTETAGDYHKPAVTVAGDGSVFVAWPAQVNRNWDIYGRVRDPRTGWGKTERWTNDPAPDIAPGLASADGRVMLIWQGFRKNNLDILYRMHNGGAWGQEGYVTDNPANDWDPVVAASNDGEFHVAWDSFRGDYDVFLRTMKTSGAWADPVAVARTPKLENHPSLSLDARNRLWIAWETGPENWAGDSHDGGLRPHRDVEFACFDNGKLYRAEAAGAALRKLGGTEGMQAPVIAAGRDGLLRMFYRQPVNKNFLSVYMTAWESGGWSSPEKVLYSEGRIDQRVVTASLEDKTLIAYPAGSSHNIVYAKLYGAGIGGSGAEMPLTLAESAVEKPALPAKVKHMLKGRQLVWGDLHRHTDISEDGGIVDGSLRDTFRYALDPAALDFIGVTDHTRYQTRRYNLWRIQQITDQYYRPGVFSPVHSYERSQYSPWGHRNIVNLNRDYIPVPGSYDIGDTGVSPWGLYEALRGKNAITIPHTSAWANKQVSWDYYDPEIERLVEIYQGSRSTYEYNGAPDPGDRAIYEKDSKNFVWDALARKRRLGFIASSDHFSTHMSFAAVYTRAIDRESIFAALKARSTYAATDRILLDFTLGDNLMGSQVVVAGVPEFQVKVEGTAPLARIDVIKDGKFVYNTSPSSTTPNARAAQFTYRDQEFNRDTESYYYVRVIQTDKMMAWASPIWVTAKK